MNISWLDEKSKRAWDLNGGGLLEGGFSLGKSSYTVDVLPQENKN